MSTTATLHLVRQPIFDPAGNLQAYQIVTGGDALLDVFSSLDASRAASRLLSDVFLETDVHRVAGGLPVVLRLPVELLAHGVMADLPPDLTILEIDTEVEVTPAVVATLSQLRRDGYRLASSAAPDGSLDPDLLPLVTMVKLDVSRLDGVTLAATARTARRAGKRIVAEHVDTRQQESAARLVGFDGYTGRFFQQPAPVEGARLDGSRMAFLRLLTAANAAEVDFDAVADIIRGDVALAWKFLNYINAAYFGWQRRIESITQGLVMLGENGVRRWVSLIVVSELGRGRSELVQEAITRARWCERLAERIPGSSASPLGGFLVGMFSLLDAMLDRPLPEILERVSLPGDVEAAILRREGQLGLLLATLIAFERGAWDTAEGRAEALGLPLADLTSSYLDAIMWARDILATPQPVAS